MESKACLCGKEMCESLCSDSNICEKELLSSTTLFIIIGVVVGIVIAGVVAAMLIIRSKNNKGRK